MQSIRERREALLMTPAEFANELGITTTHVYRMEMDPANPHARAPSRQILAAVVLLETVQQLMERITP